jgi:hypothetical protein
LHDLAFHGFIRNQELDPIGIPSNIQHPWYLVPQYVQKPLLNHLLRGFNPAEKYETQLGSLFPIYGKKKNVPNHQPAIVWESFIYGEYIFTKAHKVPYLALADKCLLARFASPLHPT